MCSESEGIQSNNQSNFFSIANDSHWLKLNSEINLENLKVTLKDEECDNNEEENILNASISSIDAEIRKNLEFIKEDDLNNAKLDDSSIFSEKYSAIKMVKTCNQSQFLNPNLSNSSSLIDFNTLNINKTSTPYNYFTANNYNPVENNSFFNEYNTLNPNNPYKSSNNIHKHYPTTNKTNTNNNTFHYMPNQPTLS